MPTRAHRSYLALALACLLLVLAAGHGTRADTGYTQTIGAAYASPTQAGTLGLWLRADQGITYGGMAVPVHYAGTGPELLQPTGTPGATVQGIEVDITLLGGVGAAQFQWLLNGVVQQTAQTTAATFAMGSTGVTWKFAAGSYVATDVYTSVPVVGTWTSIDAGASAFTQATAANMPAWVAPGLSLHGWAAGANGQAAVRFNGTSAYLKDATFAMSAPYTFFLVCNPTSGSAVAMVWSDQSANYEYFSSPPSGGVTYLNNVLYKGPVVGPGLETGIVNGSSSQFPIGHMVGFGNAGTTAFVRLLLGSFDGASDYFGGDVEELLLYPSILGAQQVGGTEGYAVARYALP